ncbi:hypothetical protein, partial [Geobacillus kaustophilus]|uniref:hypothetical protein n=1 Tax=Geobacillus kaustophilus TaxID=1462 RepID=UPI001C3F4937
LEKLCQIDMPFSSSAADLGAKPVFHQPYRESVVYGKNSSQSNLLQWRSIETSALLSWRTPSLWQK